MLKIFRDHDRANKNEISLLGPAVPEAIGFRQRDKHILLCNVDVMILPFSFFCFYLVNRFATLYYYDKILSDLDKCASYKSKKASLGEGVKRDEYCGFYHTRMFG